MAKINWFPGHMNKAMHQIKDALNNADFVVELRDARAPQASANPLLKELIQDKPRLIVLNKADLADPEQSTCWQKYLSSDSCSVLSLSQKQQQNKQKLLRALQQSFGGRKKKGPAGTQWVRAARGLVLGIPNVGKSTLINSLLGRQKLKTEDRAGVTRKISLVHLNEDYSLFDSPGMLWPNLGNQHAAARLAIMGSIREQVVEEEQLLCYLVQELESLYPDLLRHHYQVEEAQAFAKLHSSLQWRSMGNFEAGGEQGSESEDLLCQDLDIMALYHILDVLGKRLQCLEKGGEVAYRRLLSRLLRDFQKGKLGQLSLEHVSQDRVG